MKKARFCYEINAEAGMSEDVETGEPCAAYARIDHNLPNGELGDMPDELYDTLHNGAGIKMVSEATGVHASFIKPISTAEYDAKTEDEPEEELA